PEEDHEGYAWVDPAPDPRREQACGNCHAAIYREWAASGHSRSVTGRAFRDLYSGAGGSWGLLAQRPEGAGVCSSCHAPALADEDPAVFDLRRVRGTAAHGTHCDFCHKVAGPGEGQFGLAHGRFQLRVLRPRHGQLFFGPLDDVDRGEDAHSPFQRDSAFCAACHEGVVFGVHVYSTYSEWLQSPARAAGRHCQSCHMAPTGRMTNVAPARGGRERDPWSLASHRMFRGSQRDMLRDCLRLEAGAWRQGGAVTARVTLEARNVGHRV